MQYRLKHGARQVKHPEIQVGDRVRAGHIVVSNEAQRLVRDKPTASRHELSELLITNLASQYPGFIIDYFDAYYAIMRFHKPSRVSSIQDGTGSDIHKTYMRRPTLDDYNRWIPILMQASDSEAKQNLAKRIYINDPTFWGSPRICVRWLGKIAQHGRSLRDAKGTLSQTRQTTNDRIDVIASLQYRRDHICKANAFGVDTMAFYICDSSYRRGFWLKEEDDKIIELIINAYVNPKEVRRWIVNQPVPKGRGAKIGSISMPQFQRAIVVYLRHLDYWLGTYRTHEDVTKRLDNYILLANVRKELNTKFQRAGRAGLEKKRSLVEKEYKELTDHSLKLRRKNVLERRRRAQREDQDE